MNQELSNFGARLRETISFGGHCFVNAPINQGSDEALPSMRGDDAIFNQFALDLFALQIKHNGAYRIICAARGLTPEAVGHWTQIPAVPTTAFKELELSCIPPDQRTAVFHSSGTSKQKPSRHFHCPASLELYEASLWSWFHRHVVPECGIRNAEFGILILAPPPGQAFHSSLVHMFEIVRRNMGGASVPASRSEFVGTIISDGSWTLHFDAVIAALNASLITRRPSLILGTAFSFVHLLDFLNEHDLRFRLPPGSRVMETGGYKNRSRAMPKGRVAHTHHRSARRSGRKHHLRIRHE